MEIILSGLRCRCCLTYWHLLALYYYFFLFIFCYFIFIHLFYLISFFFLLWPTFAPATSILSDNLCDGCTPRSTTNINNRRLNAGETVDRVKQYPPPSSRIVSHSFIQFPIGLFDFFCYCCCCYYCSSFAFSRMALTGCLKWPSFLLF